MAPAMTAAAVPLAAMEKAGWAVAAPAEAWTAEASVVVERMAAAERRG